MSYGDVAFTSEVKTEAVHNFLNHFSLGQVKGGPMQKAFCELKTWQRTAKTLTLPSLNYLECSSFLFFFSEWYTLELSFLDVNILPVQTSPDLLKLETTDVHLGGFSIASISLIWVISLSTTYCVPFPCRFVLSFHISTFQMN